MSQSEAGKGSAPRKEQDQEAYRKGWEAIFGKKEKPKDQSKDQSKDRK